MRADLRKSVRTIVQSNPAKKSGFSKISRGLPLVLADVPIFCGQIEHRLIKKKGETFLNSTPYSARHSKPHLYQPFGKRYQQGIQSRICINHLGRWD